MSEADRRKALEDIAAQRWVEAEGGQKTYIIGTPETITADSPDVAKEFYDYYPRHADITPARRRPCR
jgi:uncharacterized protein